MAMRELDGAQQHRATTKIAKNLKLNDWMKNSSLFSIGEQKREESSAHAVFPISEPNGVRTAELNWREILSFWCGKQRVWEREREWKEIGISKLSCIMPFWLNPLRVPLSCAVGPIPLLFVHTAHPRHGRQILLFFDDTGDKLEYNWLILAFSR